MFPRRMITRAIFPLVAVLALAGCSSGSKPSSGSAVSTAPKGSYAFWPLAPDTPRIQFIRAYRGSDDVVASNDSALANIVFGKDTPKGMQITKPYGVAMHNGKIYTCDMRGSTVVVFDLPKQQMRLIGSSGANRLNHPVAVAVAPDGMLYVADNERGAIVAFDAEERYSHVIGFPKFKPGSVAVHGDRVLACDLGSQTVQVFNRSTGAQIGTIGRVGDADGEFRLPLGIATDKSGNVYVIDMMRCRLQKFSPDGTFLAATGAMGDAAGTFARPKHIAVDSDGIIYVVDAAFQNVQMFDDQFRLLMSFGAAGDFPGAMDLPAGIAVCEDSLGLFKDQIHPGFDAKRLVVVTNQFGNNKVSIYAMGQPAKGYTAADLSRAAVQVSSGTGVEADSLKLQQALPQNQSAQPADPGATGQTPAPKAANPPAKPATPPASPR